MSLKTTGIRPPATFRETYASDDDQLGIPGAARPALFYQDRSRLPTVSHGRGVFIYDTDGKDYLDGCSGAVSANLGHGHERMAEAARRQMERIAFAYRLQFENEPANELADLLARLSPPSLCRVFFVNSGSEGVEAAIKLARQYWWTLGEGGKSLVISRRPSYHGATLGALAATDYAPLKRPFLAMTPRSPKVSAPFCYHCPLSLEYPGCHVACAWELERSLLVHGAENVAAFIIEPIGGATTGAAVPPDEYMPIVERICNEHGVLLIIDDVMTGCGRTGTFYGYEHWDITPDIVVTSKGLSAGYAPIGAIIADAGIVETVLGGGGFMHGHTYAGNPLSTAIALEAVRIILDEGLVEHARDAGTYLHEKLQGLKDRFPFVGDVRGRGLFAAVELVRDRTERRPFPANWYVALEGTEVAREHGLLVYPRRPLFGLAGDHLLVAPPLIVSHDEIDELVRRLEATLVDLAGLLDQHVAEAARDWEDDTHARFEQADKVPPYARGDLDRVRPATDANVTAAMEAGRAGPGWPAPLTETEEP